MEIKKAFWGVKEIQINGEVKIDNVITATLNNYSDDVVTFICNGIKRNLPPVDATLNIPTAPFKISMDGVPFDLEVTFEFPTGKGNSSVVIDYGQIKQC